MTRPRRKKLPSRVGFCHTCRKDNYPDEISAGLALEQLSRDTPRGAVEPVRFYKCPHSHPSYPRFHLTSQPQRTEYREINHSA